MDPPTSNHPYGMAVQLESPSQEQRSLTAPFQPEVNCNSLKGASSPKGVGHCRNGAPKRMVDRAYKNGESMGKPIGKPWEIEVDPLVN